MTNGAAGHRYRFLIIEDDKEIARQLQEACAGFLDAPDVVESETCENFAEATDRLDSRRYDMLVVDLKDDSNNLPDEESLPGLRVFEEIKKRRFVPVVFYTALPKFAPQKQTAFVRVVEKTQGLGRLQEEVRKIFQTRLPALSRHIEEHQRTYMWDFVSEHWAEFESPHEQADLAYLLARRLARSLETLAEKLVVDVGGVVGAHSEEAKSHPMTMYIRPPIGPHLLAGDILREKKNETEYYWLMLTPSCDFAQGKVTQAVLARCERLDEQEEYKAWISDATKTSNLEQLLANNRTGKHGTVKLQPERFMFLPGTFFMPDILVDFQQIRSFPLGALSAFEAVATLDSPFSEAVLARFARYFGRVGTPDIDKKLVLDRLKNARGQTAGGQAAPAKPERIKRP